MKDRHGNEWVFVPAIPTDEMKHAAQHAAPPDLRKWKFPRDVIAAAIAAAPKFDAVEVTQAEHSES